MVEENKDVKKLLEVVLKKTNEGWDYSHVTEGLIKLGFILLDCPGLESEVGLYILGRSNNLIRQEISAQCYNYLITHVTIHYPMIKLKN